MISYSSWLVTSRLRGECGCMYGIRRWKVTQPGSPISMPDSSFVVMCRDNVPQSILSFIASRREMRCLELAGMYRHRHGFLLDTRLSKRITQGSSRRLNIEMTTGAKEPRRHGRALCEATILRSLKRGSRIPACSRLTFATIETAYCQACHLAHLPAWYHYTILDTGL